MKAHKFLLVSLFLFGYMTAQGQAKKDSLWSVWNNESAPDTNRLKAIQALTWPMLNVNLDSAYLLAAKQLALATEIGNKKWISKALYNIATHYYLKSDYKNSIDYYNRSLVIRRELGDLKGEAAIYGNLGLIFGDQGNLVKDLEYQLKSLAINEQLNDTPNLTSNYGNLATIYQEQEDSTKALEYYNKALEMHKAENNLQHIGLTYNNLGNMYRQHNNYP